LPAGERPRQVRRALTMALLVGLGAAAMLSLQLAHWRLLYGQWLTIPQGTGFMNWTAPHWRQVLFSSFKGLLPWMPVFFPALAGLVIQLKKQRRFVLPLLIVLLLELYINSSSADWFAGGGYGPRRFTGELAILVVGYGGLLEWLPRRARLLGGGLAALLLSMEQWLLLRFGLAQGIGGQLLSMAPDYRWVEDGYPAFFRQLGKHLGELVRRPLQMLHWPGSPAAIVGDGGFPVRQMAALAAAGLFVGLCWLAGRRLLRWHSTAAGPARWLWLVLLALLVASLDIWLLTWA
jgi:hypothetical protein